MAGSNAARRVARWVTAVGAGLVTAATGGTPAAAQPDARGARQLADTAALRAELERVNGEELAAVARGDAAGAAALYTADAVLLPPDGRVIRGREAIRSYWASGGGAVITDVRTTTVAAGGGGTTAYLAGEYALTSRGAGAVPATNHGTFLLVFRRERAGWRIAQDMWTARSTP